MKLSYLLKLTVVCSSLSLLPFHNAFAGCPCNAATSSIEEEKSDNAINSDVNETSNALTQDEPMEGD